jgi:hypothetical protein
MFEARARIERETFAAAGLSVPADNHLVIRNGPAFATADSLFTVLDVLDRMTHTLLIAPPDESFVTSDRPALIHADLGFAGLANRHCEASLPLTPSVLLLLWWGGIENSCYCPTDADMRPIGSEPTASTIESS